MNQNITSWEEIKLAKVGKIITGKTPPTNQTKYYNGEYPFITPTDMNDNRHIITERYLSDKAAKRYPNYLLPKNSVCFTCIGATIGKMCKTNSKSFTNQQINSVVVNQHYDSDFIYYLLKTYKENIVNLAAGAATPIVNKTLFSNIEILVPKLPIQRTIGLYLAAFDDLIENNQTRIGLLEEMAQLLYREWFVEFRFPGYEKHKFVDSELGKIPEGWRVGIVNEILTIKSGFPFKSSTYIENGKYRIITIGNVGDQKFDPNTNDTIDSLPKKLPEYCILNNGDILISLTGNIGRVCLVYGNENYLLNQRVGKVQYKKLEYRGFAYTLLNSYYLKKYLENISNGAAQQNLSPIEAGKLKVVIPTEEILSEYNKVIKPMLDEIVILNNQNQVLSIIRDLLLPKLMSGEIDVSKLDIKVEE